MKKNISPSAFAGTFFYCAIILLFVQVIGMFFHSCAPAAKINRPMEYIYHYHHDTKNCEITDTSIINPEWKTNPQGYWLFYVDSMEVKR